MWSSTFYRMAMGNQLTNSGTVRSSPNIRPYCEDCTRPRHEEQFDNRYRPPHLSSARQGHVWAAEELLEKGETRHAVGTLFVRCALAEGLDPGPF